MALSMWQSGIPACFFGLANPKFRESQDDTRIKLKDVWSTGQIPLKGVKWNTLLLSLPSKASRGSHKQQFSVQPACAPAQRDSSQCCTEPQPNSPAGGKVHELGLRAGPAWGSMAPAWESGVWVELRHHCWQSSAAIPQIIFLADNKACSNPSSSLPNMGFGRMTGQCHQSLSYE